MIKESYYYYYYYYYYFAVLTAVSQQQQRMAFAESARHQAVYTPSQRAVSTTDASIGLHAWMHISKCFSMASHIRSHRAPCSCFPKKASLQLSSEQSVGDVVITQLDWKRVPQARSGGCKSSVAVTAECWRHHASQNVS